MSMKPYYKFAEENESTGSVIVIKFKNGVTAVIVDLYCINPDCNCVDVTLDFIETDEDKNYKGRLFSLCLNTKTWEASKKNIENKVLNCEDMIEEFMNGLDEEFRETLQKRVVEAKEYGKENPLEWFDELELEEGSCFGYSEVFGERDVEKFTFDYKETNYFVDDQYCTNPECKCNEVVLTFIDIIPSRDAQEPRFAISLSLETGLYKVEFSNNITKGEMKEIIERFKEHISNDFELFKKRYALMKEFGKKRIERKKQNSDLPSIKSSKIGRNEPCPCGSGKKYKKCCGK